jgi:polysaccharide pyruvyl transferase WcaK-like protein
METSKKQKNILFVTVRQENCGDEFILFGTQNIISTMEPTYNPIILNKNVEVCRRLKLRNKVADIRDHVSNNVTSVNLEELCFQNEPLYDNSFADYYSLDGIDCVVFAGSPEWVTNKLSPLYGKLVDFTGPIFFLGPGIHEGFEDYGPYSRIPNLFRNIHKKADVFVVRESLLLNYLRPEVNAKLLPCPALLCAKHHKARTSINKIGFSLQVDEGNARVMFIPKETYDFSIRLLDAISKHYEVEIVCHWIEDLIHLHKVFGNRYPIRYSYDAKDYLDIYNQYDLVVSTRVHGSGMAASLGIPSFTISHSKRTDTVQGFLSRVIDPNTKIVDIVERVKSFDVFEASRIIIAHKDDTLLAYKELLKPFFPL